MKTEIDHAREQAKAQLESITKMVAALEAAEPHGTQHASEEAFEEAEQAIHDDPLEIAIRDDWYSPGASDTQQVATEFKILLCTGGPAVRIIGTLDRWDPITASIEYQDWGTPWTEYRLTSDQEEIVLRYCRCFYFGE